MIKKVFLWTLLMSSSVNFAQQFDSKSNEFINLDTHEVNLKIENTPYNGKFEYFKSKKDRQEYLIYSYFSRSIILQLNITSKDIMPNTSELIIKKIKLVHSTDLKSITKSINKNGFDNCDNCITVFEDINHNLILTNRTVNIEI